MKEEWERRHSCPLNNAGLICGVEGQGSSEEIGQNAKSLSKTTWLKAEGDELWRFVWMLECCGEPSDKRKICSCHWSSIHSRLWGKSDNRVLVLTTSLVPQNSEVSLAVSEGALQLKQMWGWGIIHPLRWASWAWKIHYGCSWQMLEVMSLYRPLNQFIPRYQKHKIQREF